MTYDPLATIVEALEAGGWDPRQEGSGYIARCPAHQGEDQNLHIGVTGDGKAWLSCKSRECDGWDVLSALGLTLANLYPDFDPDFTGEDVEWTTAPSSPPALTLAYAKPHKFVYTDEKGAPFAVVERQPDKSFKQGLWQGREREPKWDLGGAHLPLYRLHELAAANDDIAWVVEGEKDADNLVEFFRAWGIDVPVTTTPGGAGPELFDDWLEPLRRFKAIVVVPDNDWKGMKRAEQWAASGLPVRFLVAKTGNDITDHLAAGLDTTDLVRLTPTMVNERRREFEALEWPVPWSIDGASARPKLPMHAIPPLLRDVVRHVAADRQAAPDVVFATYLAAVSGLWCEHVSVIVGRNWVEHINLYVLVVAESGDGKSPAFGPAQELVKEINEWRVKQYDDRRIAAKQTLLSIKEALKQGGSSVPTHDLLATEEEAKAVVEMDGRIITDDVTPEALAVRLQKSGGLVVIIDSEGLVVHHLLGLYSATPNIALLLKGWDGGAYYRDRIGLGMSVAIPKVLLSICAAIQPGVMARFMADRVADDRGLTARFLVTWPESMAGRRTQGDKKARDVDSVHTEPLHNHVNDMLIELQDNPRTLVLEREAALAFMEWHDNLERRIPTMEGKEKKATPKYRADALRIAANFHLLTQPAGGAGMTVAIDVKTMKNAIIIADYFMAHLEAMDSEANPIVLRDAHRILAWLVESGKEEEKLSAIARGAGLYKKAGDAERCLRAVTLLIERGWLEARDRRGWQQQLGRGNAKASPVFRVHPQAGKYYIAPPEPPPSPSVDQAIPGIPTPSRNGHPRRRIQRHDTGTPPTGIPGNPVIPRANGPEVGDAWDEEGIPTPQPPPATNATRRFPGNAEYDDIDTGDTT